MRRINSFSFIIVVLLLVASCASNPYAETNRMHKKQAKIYAKQLQTFPPAQSIEESMLKYGENWVGTTNFGLRKPNFVVIHHTAQDSVEHTLKTFTLPRTSVSSHYVISDDGEIYHMLNDYYRAWHAGTGKWGNDTDLNSSSIGIELDNNGSEPFSEAQISSLIDLLTILKEKYKIPTANFIGHSDLAPSRKVDPNITFPWERLAEEGFGYWYDKSAVATEIIQDGKLPEPIKIEAADSTALVININDSLEEQDTIHNEVEPKLALRIIGYDVSDLDAAIKAFELHFIQEDVDGELSDSDLRILYNLYKKYM
ncbi:MAG TPA: N-acetylmuramoyl-L-alanine amidase [Salinimicrobium sp.]|nr:N-acetylmuramoyl-L-alanine amidase [Salinimicrobium sp.]